MGVGLVFVGYFFVTLMSINVAGAFIKIIGYGIIFISAGKLNKYNRSFGLLRAFSVAMLVLSVLLAAHDVESFLYDNLLVNKQLFTDTFRTFVGYVEMAMTFVFNAAMLYSIRNIAIETGTNKIAVSAVRNFAFICIYYILNVIAVLPFDFVTEYIKYFSVPVFALYLVWIILNLVLIYSCYARICDENDLDMLRKPSRFDFVNKMRSEFDSKEQRALEKHAEYQVQKREKRNSKRR